MNIDLETKLQTVTWEKEQAMQNGDAVCRAADAQIKRKGGVHQTAQLPADTAGRRHEEPVIHSHR